LTQQLIATRVFGRREEFDPLLDPIVRIQAGRLRRSLERYYLLSGKSDPVHIELPRGSYVPTWTRQADLPHATTSGTGDGWPSLILLPCSADDDAGAAIARRLCEELLIELGRHRAVRVFLARDIGGSAPSARFALSAAVRTRGDRQSIAARLVDRASGEQVWADEFHTLPTEGHWSGSPDDIAHVIAARVGADEGVVVQLMTAESRTRGGELATTYDAILGASAFLRSRRLEALAPAVEALQRAVAREPECSQAWVYLSRLYITNYAFEITALSTPIDEALELAHRAVRLDPTSMRARCVLASALLVKGELPAGREVIDEALRLNPRSLVYLEIAGYLLVLLGDFERGAELSRIARRRNPHCMPHVHFGLWAYHLGRGEVEPAYQAALEYPETLYFWRSLMRASCLGLLGRSHDARQESAALLAQKTDFCARWPVLVGHFLKFPEMTGRVVDGLSAAGLDLPRHP
jgi:tetratricopeptide (TPR) repeat protein